MNKFNRPTFESPGFLLESPDVPSIKPGGSSNSNTLNRYHNTISREVGLLGSRLSAIAARSDRVEALVSSSSAALLAQFQALSTRVDQASGYSKILCDLHQTTYVDTGATSAALSYEFGQATLPIQSTVDLLTQVDSFGEVRVSNEVEISRALGGNPGTLDYSIDPEAIYMLREEQSWLMSPVASGTTMWTKIKAPLQYRGLAPNVLELWPACPMTTDLLEVSYQLAGDSFTSSWTALDLSYLPNYTNSVGRVQFMGPVRIHLPSVGLSQIRIKQQARMDTVWGWERIKIYHREYESQGTLVVKDPYSRSISSPLLRGRDAATLSLLSSTINGSTMSINLTTTDSSVTPVITGVVLDV